MRRDRAGLYEAVEVLQRLAEIFEHRRQQLAAEVGLTDSQWRVLEEIESEVFMPSLFARSREISPAAISRTLRQLLDRKLVAVSISERDARERAYRLTPKGRRLLERLRENRERAIDAVWAGFPGEDVRRFAHFGRDLADRLEAYAERASR